MSTHAKILSICKGALCCMVSAHLIFISGDSAGTGSAAIYYKPHSSQSQTRWPGEWMGLMCMQI